MKEYASPDDGKRSAPFIKDNGQWYIRTWAGSYAPIWKWKPVCMGWMRYLLNID